MGSERTSAVTSHRRLKFSSVRRLEADGPSPAEAGPAFVSPGEALATAYVAVARRLLLGLETLQDERAARRAANSRGSGSAASPGARPDPES